MRTTKPMWLHVGYEVSASEPPERRRDLVRVRESVPFEVRCATARPAVVRATWKDGRSPLEWRELDGELWRPMVASGTGSAIMTPEDLERQFDEGRGFADYFLPPLWSDPVKDIGHARPRTEIEAGHRIHRDGRAEAVRLAEFVVRRDFALIDGVPHVRSAPCWGFVVDDYQGRDLVVSVALSRTVAWDVTMGIDRVDDAQALVRRILRRKREADDVSPNVEIVVEDVEIETHGEIPPLTHERDFLHAWGMVSERIGGLTLREMTPQILDAIQSVRTAADGIQMLQTTYETAVERLRRLVDLLPERIANDPRYAVGVERARSIVEVQEDVSAFEIEYGPDDLAALEMGP